MAGAVGVPPWSYTYGELALMDEGRDAAQWWHTAGLMSIVLGFGGVKRSPAELHPYEVQRRKQAGIKPEIQEAIDAGNKAAWRAFCQKFER